MKSIDPLLGRKFDRDHYHCVHFLIDAGKHLFNYDFSQCFLGLTGSLNTTLSPTKDSMTKGELVEHPTDATIILMTKLDNTHHVGLYYCGRVLHLSEVGTRFEALRSIKRQYKKVKFYDVKDFSQRA
ncbi:hypothetical protein J3492_00325 [Psychrobacter sp. F1192]|uniref:NlpC/P60 domain-containing protein n=1 Tax=Psychrobacter coccoides TaxID=2818440 RepID=A0ABS3NJT3_9GAMM|nr:hypothetical protein [Psychrobacter coccoides]MBO1529659.1 hypothetical protein [Psychrobacter coccoides]